MLDKDGNPIDPGSPGSNGGANNPSSPSNLNPHIKQTSDYKSRIEEEKKQLDQMSAEERKAYEELQARVQVIIIQHDPATGQIAARPMQNVRSGFELVSLLREALVQVEKSDVLNRVVTKVGPILAKQLRAELESLVGGR